MKKVLLLILFICGSYFSFAQDESEIKCLAYGRVFDREAEHLNFFEKKDGNTDMLYQYGQNYFILIMWATDTRTSFTILKVPSLEYWDGYVKKYEQSGAADAYQKYAHYELCTFDEPK